MSTVTVILVIVYLIFRLSIQTKPPEKYPRFDFDVIEQSDWKKDSTMVESCLRLGTSHTSTGFRTFTCGVLVGTLHLYTMTTLLSLRTFVSSLLFHFHLQLSDSRHSFWLFELHDSLGRDRGGWMDGWLGLRWIDEWLGLPSQTLWLLSMTNFRSWHLVFRWRFNILWCHSTSSDDFMSEHNVVQVWLWLATFHIVCRFSKHRHPRMVSFSVVSRMPLNREDLGSTFFILNTCDSLYTICIEIRFERADDGCDTTWRTLAGYLMWRSPLPPHVTIKPPPNEHETPFAK